ncbi:MAG: hypothetical protein ABF750_09315 [Oenococcus oeni]
MNLKEAQGLEAALFEYENISQDFVPNSKHKLHVVYFYKNHFLTCNFSGFELIKFPNEEKEINFFVQKVWWDLRRSDKFQPDWSGRLVSYKNREPQLLDNLIKVVNDINDDQFKISEYPVKNVFFLILNSILTFTVFQ